MNIGLEAITSLVSLVKERERERQREYEREREKEGRDGGREEKGRFFLDNSDN